jgi:hypothetical protein
MFALGGLALHWLECQYLKILILRLNANISVWMFRYSEPRHDIEVKCQLLFGWNHTWYWMVQVKTTQPKFHVRNRQISTQVCLAFNPSLKLHGHVHGGITPQTHELLKLCSEQDHNRNRGNQIMWMSLSRWWQEGAAELMWWAETTQLCPLPRPSRQAAHQSHKHWPRR